MRRKLTRVTAREIYLAAFAALIVLEARYWLRFKSIDRLRRWATTRGKRFRPRAHLLVAFRRATARVGGTCLVRALALQRFLSRNGHSSELRIGVGRTEKGFGAHAWLVDGEDILEGAGQESATYALLANWPSNRP